jgi:iron complex transport system permease protein
MRGAPRPLPTLVVLSLLLLVLFACDLCVGSLDLSFGDIMAALTGGETENSKIVSMFRLPKAFAAVFAGVSLSVSGLQMQTMFRNPLADPYVLGVSSGAGLGVALFTIGFSSLSIVEPLREFGAYLSALGGSALALALVLAVSSRMKDIMSVLILGVMFGSGISAIISILQYFGSAAEVKTYVIWTMGSLGSIPTDKLWIPAVALFAGTTISVVSVKPLNALLPGETYAKSAGVNIRRTRNLVFLGTSILTGTTTAFCGPIGFIGIAVPHIVRMIFRRADHRILLPGTMLAGACLMLLCDIASQSLISDLTLPVNSVAALLGIPVIIFVIATHRS